MKILVGLSGGVDSAVAAYLLKEQGYDVTCAFMRNWDSMTNSDYAGNPTAGDEICPQETDYLDAKSVADSLGLPLLRIDFIQEYWEEVFQTFLSEYKKGRTPNPDILCNKYIKFDKFLDFAHQNGFETLATGHYAKMGEENGKPVLQKADDRNKDQSYFLCQISREVLSHTVFPLGTISKPEVRKIASELNLSIANKKDSTGICFIGERKFREFLSNYLPMKPGKIIHILTHKVVGQHKGVLYYTLGQRKGLDIGGTGPYFVCGKDIYKNELYVVDESSVSWLSSNSCMVSGINRLADFKLPISCNAKFRYRAADQPVTIEEIDKDHWKVSYPQTIANVTPGQEAVFYLGDTVLAGGVIDDVFKDDENLMDLVRKQAQTV